MNELITWRKELTDPIQVGDATIALQSQALKVRLPYVGFVWQRPTAVFVTQHGRSEKVPIVDVTRNAIWIFSSLAILVNVLVFLGNRVSRR